MSKVREDKDESSKDLEDTQSEEMVVKDDDDMPLAKLDKEDDEPKGLSLIEDETLLGVYGEILTNLREDREQVSELLDTFANMVVNDGDSSTASKEALVNLAKTKIDASDRMAKIADLMTRVKLKQPDTFKPYMKKEGYDGSGPTINIYDNSGVNKRALMEAIQKEKKD